MSDSATISVTPPVSVPALPEGVREGNENLILLTASAGRKVAALIAREQAGEFLRVAITGGGCNGLSYKMKFVSDPKRGDILVRTGGARVVVDSKSALYLILRPSVLEVTIPLSLNKLLMTASNWAA